MKTKKYFILFAMLYIFQTSLYAQHNGLHHHNSHHKDEVWLTVKKMPLYKNMPDHHSSVQEAAKDIRKVLNDKKIKLPKDVEANIIIDTLGKVTHVNFITKGPMTHEMVMLRTEIMAMQGWTAGEQEDQKVFVRVSLHIAKPDFQMKEEGIVQAEVKEGQFEFVVEYVSFQGTDSSKARISGVLTIGTLKVGDKGVLMIGGEPRKIFIESINNGNDKNISSRVSATLEIKGASRSEITINSVLKDH